MQGQYKVSDFCFKYYFWHGASCKLAERQKLDTHALTNLLCSHNRLSIYDYFLQRESLWPCIITHGVFNSLSIFSNKVNISLRLEIIIAAVLCMICVIYAPVSYTHLDVYKRQPLHLPRIHDRFFSHGSKLSAKECLLPEVQQV